MRRHHDNVYPSGAICRELRADICAAPPRCRRGSLSECFAETRAHRASHRSVAPPGKLEMKRMGRLGYGAAPRDHEKPQIDSRIAAR